MAHSSEIEKLERRWMDNPMGLTFAPLAEACRRAGDHPRALEILELGLAQHPAYVPALIVQARCHLDAALDGSAEAAFRRVTDADPHNLIALKGLADICERAGRGAEADAFLVRLLDADPTHEEARAQRARLAESPPVAIVESPAEVVAEVVAVIDAPEEVVAEVVAVIDAPEEVVAEAAVEVAEVVDVFTPPPVVDLPPLEPEPATEPEPVESDFAIERDENPFEGFDASAWELPFGDGMIPDQPFEESAGLEMTGPADPPADLADSADVEFDSPPAWAPFSGDGMNAESAEDAEFDTALIDPPSWAPVTMEQELATGAADVEPAAVEFAPTAAEFESTDPVIDAGPDDFDAVPESIEPARAIDPEQLFADEPPIAPVVGASFPAADLPDDDWMSSWDADPEPEEPAVTADALLVEPIAEADDEPADQFAPSSVEEIDPEPVDAAPDLVESSAGLDGVAAPWSEWPDAPPAAVEEFAVAEPTPIPAIEPDAVDVFLDEQVIDVADDPVVVVDGALDEEVEMAAVAEPDAADLAEAQPELVVTETMAEIFLRQGHKPLALAVYAELLGRAPDDPRLARAVAQLRLELSPPAEAGGPAEQEGGEPVGAFLARVLGPEAADPEVDELPADAADEGPLGGRPTRPADDPALRLSTIFGDEPAAPRTAAPARPADDGDGEPSFDEFFGEQGVPAGAAGEESDLEQFNAWLRGLQR